MRAKRLHLFGPLAVVAGIALAACGGSSSSSSSRTKAAWFRRSVRASWRAL